MSVLRWDDRTVCKPYSVREHEFYERAHASKALSDFLPGYKGESFLFSQSQAITVTVSS